MAIHSFVDVITKNIQMLVKDNASDSTTLKSMTIGMQISVKPTVSSGKVIVHNTGISVKSNNSVQVSNSYIPFSISKRIDSDGSDFNLEVSASNRETKVSLSKPSVAVFKSNFVWV